jgi:hypothetical protein
VITQTSPSITLSNVTGTCAEVIAPENLNQPFA